MKAYLLHPNDALYTYTLCTYALNGAVYELYKVILSLNNGVWQPLALRYVI